MSAHHAPIPPHGRFLPPGPFGRCSDAGLVTPAERTRYRETSTHAEVGSLCAAIARRCPSRVRLLSMGRTPEGRDLPFLVLASDGAFTPAAARRKGRAVVMVQANIHAGEVEGKESVLMLARETALAARTPEFLRRLTVVLVPDYNADGNDRIAPGNRALDLRNLDGQVGPGGGVGTRYNARGWNLNRDYMKQDAPETRLAARTFRAWWPHLFVDCHTTDGSIHHHPLTFDTAHNTESGAPWAILYMRERFLPAMAKALLRRTGLDTTWYGNFVEEGRPERGWATYPALPRFGSHYRGLCGRPDILLEAYSYIDFEARCRAMLETLRQVLALAAALRQELIEEAAWTERRTVERGRHPGARDFVGVNYGVARRGKDGALRFDYPCHPTGLIEVLSGDRASQRAHRLGGRKVRWRIPHLRRFIATARVLRPLAYLVPASLAPRLDGHGVRYARLGAARRMEVEVSVVTAIDRTESPDVAGPVPRKAGTGGTPRTLRPPVRRETVLTVRRELRTVRVPRGTLRVPTAQPLGNLAVHLLEPEADDGLARWGFFDASLRLGKPFPVLRVPGGER